MGLDMYIYLEDKETKEVIEYSYYRKFNALQGYFVKQYELENCGKVQLTYKMINEIYLMLNEIRHNPEKAHLLLPTFPGPFFGSYKYDQIYHAYVHQAAGDFYHAKFLDYGKYNLYFTSDW
ncbi:hypothetical protein [Salinicoccus carnicancri]|uniref:hypothetical protein n=1 Tax=Salinicoccus carnicancri TaxID=558170 RepID=UPI00030C7ED4|nr:hypothetical protein [Salinicoccus carnicancri]